MASLQLISKNNKLPDKQIITVKKKIRIIVI